MISSSSYVNKLVGARNGMQFGHTSLRGKACNSDAALWMVDKL